MQLFPAALLAGLVACGSGGVRLHLRGTQWKADGFDHGLTPAK